MIDTDEEESWMARLADKLHAAHNVRVTPFASIPLVVDNKHYVDYKQDDDATRDLPTPHGKGLEILPLVLLDLPHNCPPAIRSDMTKRIEYGTHTYGEPLRAHNGRLVEVDTLQDGLDYVIYLRQGISEGRDWSMAYVLAIESIIELYHQMRYHKRDKL